MPPQIALTDHHVLVTALMLVGFFIHAQVKEARLVEQVDRLFNQVGADLVIHFC